MKKIIILIVIALVFVAFFTFDLNQYFDFAYIKSKQQELTDYFHANPVKTSLIFFIVYIVSTALSLPGAGILSILAGAIFGLFLGVLIVLPAATIGATLAFWVSRYIFRDAVQSKFGDKLKMVNEGIEKDGAFYLFTLRLIPAVPFMVINLLMGLTPMRTMVFFFTSLVGMVAGSIVYVNVGTQLAKIDSLQGVLTPKIIFAFVLLAIFPWIARKIVNLVKARKVYKGFTKPNSFDRNLIVIGAGSAGLVSSYIAAAVKAKVTLIEKHEMGGDCLNTGCVPSKALLRSAKFISQNKHAEKYGCKNANVEFDFKDIMQRVHKVINDIAPHDSIERYTKLGVECVQGDAKLKDPWTVEVNGNELTARNIILATGAKPFIPPITGLDSIEYFTSDTVWNLTELPKTMVVLGGGPIGCELAQCFARFGSQVTQVEMAASIMLREDAEISLMVSESLSHDGITTLTDHMATEVTQENGSNMLLCKHNDETIKVPFDVLLIAVGRKASTQGIWDDGLQIELQKNGKLALNEFLQTNYPNIYACGDVAGPYEFTHTAAHQAWYASVNSLFGSLKKFKVDYSVIPWCTFTEPEVARVGLNEQDARQQNIAYEVTKYDISDLDRAIADEEAYGVVKVLTVPGKDKILGVTIVGDHAGDLIAEYVSAMKYKLGLNKILSTIHIYPTMAEANKYAAGEWKRAHAPEKILNWVEKFHTLRR